MKRNASVILLELLIMLLVFSLAAALCLQAFAWADTAATQSGRQDKALLLLQNAAEVLKHCKGDFSLAARELGGSWDGKSGTVFYDADWQITSSDPVFCLRAEPEDTGAFLGTAKLVMTDPDGTVLARLTVSWQEVAP